MDKYLKPSRFDCEPGSSGADKQFKHWLRTFTNFISNIKLPTTTTTTDGATATATDHKLITLINYISPDVFEFIIDCTTYDDAIKLLTSVFVKPTNEIYARHILATRKQGDGETLDSYVQTLKQLSKDCNFKAVDAADHCNGFIRDAFISGIKSKDIRQRLLENTSLTLEKAIEQARTLETAHKNAESFQNYSFTSAATEPNNHYHPETDNQQENSNYLENNDRQSIAAVNSNAYGTNNKCFFCGKQRHPRDTCPARNSNCGYCGKPGHWASECKKKKKSNNNQQQNTKSNNNQQQNTPSHHYSSATNWPTLAAIPQCLTSNGYCKININGYVTKALVDSGSTSCSFISKSLAEHLKLNILPTNGEVSMANPSLSTKLGGECYVNFVLEKRKYDKVRLYVLDYLCAEIILGQDFMGRHDSVIFKFGGKEPPNNVSSNDLTPQNQEAAVDNVITKVQPIRRPKLERLLIA